MNLFNHSKSFFRTAIVFFLLVLCLNLNSTAGVYEVFFDKTNPQSVFASQEIAKALQSKGNEVEILSLTDFRQSKSAVSSIVLATLDNKPMMGKMRKSGLSLDLSIKEEGFCIRKGRNSEIWVVGKDAAGLMYGGFELAEIISASGIESVTNLSQSPYMAMRGVKFNIPLDVRTPTYTDASDAAQKNMPEMWNFGFCKEYIDSLAKFRYNYVSLWSLHPFPSMVRVPEYPEVALNDVHRSTTDWKENYNLNGWGLDAPEIVSNYEVIKKITIDEKMEFWRKVMRYGKERNVDFYVVTWNIFTNGTFGKYGITDKLENPVTRDYFRKSVRQMFLTYPDLAGIGLTTGENMYQYSTQEKEDWAFETYGQGVLDVLKEQPDRKITFIHRQHQTGALEIARQFAPLVDHPNVNFIFSFKYVQAHVYSSTTQPFHQGFVDEIQKEKN
ncbi:MAG: alpha-glucuronidase family glycosyl hydrolase [Bacteroidota bacterium]|nr:alpha-glucuronidase family glycosyl hydrolase [Bacteroidota bacterium]